MDCELIWKTVQEEIKKAVADAERNLPEYEIYDADIFGNRVSPTGHTLRGLCGFAWVRIIPARGKMVSWLKKNGIGRTDTYKGGYMLWAGTDLFVGGTQSVDIKYAAARAACKILNENGIRAYPESRLD